MGLRPRPGQVKGSLGPPSLALAWGSELSLQPPLWKFHSAIRHPVMPFWDLLEPKHVFVLLGEGRGQRQGEGLMSLCRQG